MTKPKFYLGVDPGTSGAMALVDGDGKLVDVIKLKETQHDVWDWLDPHHRKLYETQIDFAVLERVHSSPQMGVKSAFTFGASYGFCQGMLVAARIRFELVTPQKWQHAMGCRTGGDKNITKSRAQALFPNKKITHAIADALLLADYARRIRETR